MKPNVVLVSLVLLVSAAAFAVTCHLLHKTRPDELTWLRDEFALTPEQFQKISSLRAAYRPVCAKHCTRIGDAHDRLVALAQAGKIGTPEYAEAEAKWKAVCRECTEATQRHLNDVAATMSPDQAKRFIALIEPKLTRHDIGTPLDLR